MTIRFTPSVALGLLALELAACVGSGQTVFFTTDNMGIDVSTTPNPNAEIGFSRREGVVEPVFEDGKLPTVAASVRHDVPTIFPVSSSTGAVFSGGKAAIILTGNDTKTDKDDSHCLSKAPVGWDNRTLPEAGVSRPMVFTTDTSLGFKISFANPSATPPLPNVHLGYKRNEIALAPILGQPNGCPTGTQPGTYAVHNPSFLALAHNGVSAGDTIAGKNSFQVGQVFATGTAAEQAAGLPAVGAAFMQAAGQDAQVATGTVVPATYGPDANSTCLDRFTYASQANRDAVMTAAVSAKPGVKYSQLSQGAEYADLRKNIITKLNITCGG
jgi:hypothetical protein